MRMLKIPMQSPQKEEPRTSRPQMTCPSAIGPPSMQYVNIATLMANPDGPFPSRSLSFFPLRSHSLSRYLISTRLTRSLIARPLDDHSCGIWEKRWAVGQQGEGTFPLITRR